MKEEVKKKCEEVKLLIESGMSQEQARKQVRLGSSTWWNYKKQMGMHEPKRKVSAPKLPKVMEIEASPKVAKAEHAPSVAVLVLPLSQAKDLLRSLWQ